MPGNKKGKKKTVPKTGARMKKSKANPKKADAVFEGGGVKGIGGKLAEYLD